MSDNSAYLSRLEWEGLRQEYEIEKIRDSEERLFDSNCINVLHLCRNENYIIDGYISGDFEDAQIHTFLREKKSGERIDPISLSGNNFSGSIKYELNHCYIKNFSSKFIAYSHQETRIELQTYFVRKYTNLDNVLWLTEWYLNGPTCPFYFSRITQRKLVERYYKTRNDISTESNEYRGNSIQNTSRDYFLIHLSEYSFIIHQVPKQFGPSWSMNIGIEYRNDLGKIPSETEREAISEIIGFLFGKQLMKIGYSIYNQDGFPVDEVSINPWWNNARSICNKPEQSPIFNRSFDEMKEIESSFESLIPKYIELRNELNLNEVLWRYWYANNMPLGTNLPMYSNGIEILANSWFCSTKTKTKGVYLEKSKYDCLLQEEFQSIYSKTKNIEYGDRIFRKISDSYRMGSNERIETFFEEIGIEPSNIEHEALRKRNSMIHGMLNSSQTDYDYMIKLTEVYKTFFHRILLKILGYNSDYIDYSSIGWPKRSLDDGANG